MLVCVRFALLYVVTTRITSYNVCYTKLLRIPTYNELENVQTIIPEILRQDERLEVLVVDDNSPDGTADEVKRMMAANPRIHILERVITSYSIHYTKLYEKPRLKG